MKENNRQLSIAETSEWLSRRDFFNFVKGLFTGSGVIVGTEAVTIGAKHLFIADSNHKNQPNEKCRELSRILGLSAEEIQYEFSRLGNPDIKELIIVKTKFKIAFYKSKDGQPAVRIAPNPEITQNAPELV